MANETNPGAAGQSKDAATDAEKAAADAEARAAEAAQANKAREEAKSLNAERAPYVVAPGGSISCLLGIVDEGMPVTKRSFAGGQRDLDDHVLRGSVIKRG